MNGKRLAFGLHLLGGVAFVALTAFRLVLLWTAPVDLFIHHAYFAATMVDSPVVLGLVFYGFTLVLWRKCPLPAGWGVAYAASSGVCLFLASRPAFPAYYGAGMMRRVAQPDLYGESLAHYAEVSAAVRVSANLLFLAAQVFFLRFVWRNDRSPVPCPERGQERRAENQDSHHDRAEGG